VTLDKRFTWSTHIDQVRKKEAQRLGAPGSLLNRRNGLSIGNGVLLYKQLIRPMMDYACPVWGSAAPSHIKKLKALQYKYLQTATNAPWYSGNTQIHDDMGSPLLLRPHQISERFDSKLADVGKSLFARLGRHLR
jgi:hypothetical protein